MRVQTIIGKSRFIATKACPWACKVIKVYGGFMCFESWTDYEIWLNQK
jgi:hypothetical protein